MIFGRLIAGSAPLLGRGLPRPCRSSLAFQNHMSATEWRAPSNESTKYDRAPLKRRISLLAISLAALATFLPTGTDADEQLDLDDPVVVSSDDLVAADDPVSDDLDAADDLASDPAPAPEPAPVAAPTRRALVTAYAPGCGDSGRGTRSGTPTHWGVIATDRAVIPAWSLVEIDGLDATFRAEDTGSAVRGWHVDVWMPTCAQARRWGSQTREIRVVRWGA